MNLKGQPIKTSEAVSNVSNTPGRVRAATIADRVGPFWTLGVLVLIIAIFGVVTPNFLSQGAWIATTVATTQILILALGQTFVIATGGIDLSVGAVLGMSGMVGGLTMATLMAAGLPSGATIAIGFAAGIAAGTAAGVINGLVITKMKVTPLITTLGMLGIATGVGYLIGGGQQIATIPSDITTIGFTNLFGWIPLPVLVAAVLAVIAWYYLTKTRFGRRALAIGSSAESAKRAGINTDAHLIRIYALAGGLAGVAGMLLVARLSAASPTAGDGSELHSIAAVVIGGTSLFGGRASIAGTVIGAVIIAVLQTGLVVAAVDPFWQYVAIGVVLIVAVWADQQRSKLLARKR
ncbi:ABC transporter permease [Ruicaihuangia caeni]|uniref:ABC transporter permease n=1 Tax=Ruicaihuangia caeni TaxID=3042517 RepID=A0AAW6TAY2_9MICO|nr:ABC transporter permease [Klugiella sp. YN-L-19]MDI2099220.1 ABC transporter permease [Klugiella sp. YN-L-19]